ncbi:MAG: S-layer protein [Candidatus Micrarchaeia archaeon]|jgi:hypothetical protein
MKGINVKKIAAFAGAAVLFSAAAVAAEVTFGSTQLVDQSGQPTVKIYVGSKAQISDGVAAANIAAKIANEAYKSSTLTASVSGTPTCTVGSGVSGAGTCSIVESSKKVTLEVTLPGSVSGTHTFKTLITDTVDKTLENRNNTLSEDMYNSALTDSDTTQTASPLRAVYPSAATAYNLYRIGAGQFTGFADYAVVDNQASSTSYTEEQSFWVGTRANAVAYDNAAEYRNVIVNKYQALAYNTKFTGNDFGIPFCTTTNGSDDWTSCLSENDQTARHRVKVKFMGSEWVISSLTAPGTNTTSGNDVIAGGTVKLAKEAKYGIINVGGELDAGTFKVRLSDISVAVGSLNTHPAIIDILDANDAVVGQVQVSADTTYTFTQSGTSNQVKIHVYKTAPGFTLNAKWAEMAVYTDEITLDNGKRYNNVGSDQPDKNFKVSVLWKNRDYTATSQLADSLREIVVYTTDDTQVDKKQVAGDVVNFLKSTPTFKLTYQGVDLTDDDYEPLTFTPQSSDTLSRVAATAGDQACSATTDLKYENFKSIDIRASNGNKIGGSSSNLLPTGLLIDKVRFDPIGLTGDATQSSTSLNGTALPTTNANYTNSTLWQPRIFWKVSNADCWNWNNVAVTANTSVYSDANSIRLEFAGENSGAYGALFFTTTNTETVNSTDYFGNIVVREDAGKYGATSSNTAVYTAIPYIVAGKGNTYDTHKFKPTTSGTTQYAYYKGLGATVYQAWEPTIVTERGSKILSVGTSDVSMKIARKLGQAAFQFAYADTSGAAATADQYVMGVGESKVFGGVTVKVAAIDANAGSCSVLGTGGAPACTVDATSLNAVISPANAASVQVSQPYKLTSSMVLLDSEAVSGVAITVGGPMVNTVTAEALKDSNVNFDVDNVVVKEIGNKIVVAGKTASDTMAAADQFIAGVQRQ